MIRSSIGLLSVAVMALGAGVVSGQDYPNKPIRILTSAAGGGSDFEARQIAQAISVSLGQPVIVDNRPSFIAAEIVSKAVPDGYTLIVSGSALWTYPLLEKAPYDVMRDFSPIGLTTRPIDILVVNSSLPVTSVKELIALAKAKPGELNYGTGGSGGPPNFSAALFKTMAGINMVRVRYKGGGPALSGLLAGEVQLVFSTAAASMPHVKSGKLRALGITSAQPSALVPGLLPIATSLPGYESVSMTAVFAPAKTPAAIINRLNREIVRVLKLPDLKEAFFNIGAEIVGSSPQELGATVKSEIAKWSKVIKDAAITAD